MEPETQFFPGGEPVLSPAPVTDPVWNGRDVAVIVAFTLGCMVVAAAAGGMIWMIFHVSRLGSGTPAFPQTVQLLLAVQTAALAAGMIFAANWLRARYQVRFWQSIHWRRLTPGHALAVVAGAVALALGGQLLTPFLHMPRHVPMDRMFSPATAWPLAIYGVALAPLFEEFFFRGMLYPSLRRSFDEGMSREEARRWRPWFWVGAAMFALVTLLIMALRRLQHLPISPATRWWLAAALILAAGAPLWTQAVGAFFRLLARLRQPELLAILLTGALFGLMHRQQLAGAWGPVLLLMLVGVVLTAVRAFTHSLTASWLLHLSYNAVLFALLFVQTHGFNNFHGMHS